MFVLLTVCLLVAASPCPCLSNKTKLHIIGLIPHSESPSASIHATSMALQDINAHLTILPDYEIDIIIRDSGCNGGKATDEMYRELYNTTTTKIMIIGPACSLATEPTAQASHRWNLIQISNLASSPKLATRALYPRFFRLSRPESMMNVIKLAMFRAFNWKKVTTIHQSVPVFSVSTADFHRDAQQKGIEIIAAESFIDNPSTQVENMKKSGARIIVASFYKEMGRKVFCAAYHQKLYGAKYVWILPGWLDWNWWRDIDNSIDCSPAQMDEVMANHFIVMNDNFPSDASRRAPSVAGMTTSDFLERLKVIAGTDNLETLGSFQGTPLTYDTVWTAALSLHEAQRHLGQLDPPRLLEDFAYDSVTVQILFDVISNLTFEGISGPVKFTSSGDRLGLFLLRQLQDGIYVDVGVSNPTVGSGEEIIWDGYEPINWQGGAPPIDFVIEREDWQTIQLSLFITGTTFAVVGITLACFFLVFNIYFRKLRVIKMSSPNINNLMLIGGILAYMSIIFMGVDTAIASSDTFVWMCKANMWCLSVGFSLAFGSMFSKTWRIHKIFTNKSGIKVLVKDKWLFTCVASLVFIDGFVIILREIFDPLIATAVRGAKVVDSENDDIVYTPIRMICESRNQTYWIGAFYVIDGLLLIFGAFLAWETRKVSIPALNDSKYIGVCIYNVLIMSFVGAPVSFVLEARNAHYAIVTSLIWLSTTLTLCVVFVPKIRMRNDVQPAQSTMMSQVTETQRQVVDAQIQMHQLREEIVRLKKNRKCSRLEVASGTGVNEGAETLQVTDLDCATDQ